eukprot:1480376-Amphidinium_carterae.1
MSMRQDTLHGRGLSQDLALISNVKTSAFCCCWTCHPRTRVFVQLCDNGRAQCAKDIIAEISVPTATSHTNQN